MLDMNEPQWYIIQTQHSYEAVAKKDIEQMVEANGLQDSIFEVVMLEEEEIVERNGKRRVVKRKIFPNYLFIKMIYSKHNWYMVKQISGVKNFLSGYDGIPTPMPLDEVKRLQLEKVTIDDLDMSVGDNVNIISGPLTGFVGEVKEIKPEQEKIKVAVSMFGHETTLELEFNQVEKV